MKLVSIGEFAKMVGVHPMTLRDWHKKGILIPHLITTNGRRFYEVGQIEELKGDKGSQRKGE